MARTSQKKVAVIQQNSYRKGFKEGYTEAFRTINVLMTDGALDKRTLESLYEALDCKRQMLFATMPTED